MPPDLHTPDAYIARQDRNDKAYIKFYKEWIASMPPEEREKLLEQKGLLEPLVGHHVGGHSPDAKGDIAESSRASSEDTRIGADPDTTPPPDAQTTTVSTHEAISRIVGFLIAAPNARLASYALAFAANLNALNGLGTQGDAAKAIGVSATILSRRIEEVRTLLGLPRSAHQKGDPARLAAKKATSTNHWRNRKTKIPTTPPP
jgi:hypothetical protein